MSDKSKTIIIKKVKKGHGGAHGGSWKVAYADFVTAMMAFFLLMWLLAMVSPEKRASLSQYFKHFNLFSEAGRSFMKESSEVLSQSGGEVKAPSKEEGKPAGEADAKSLKEKLKRAVEEKLAALKNQVLIDIFEGGVRIQIIDEEGRSMFHPGSADLNERAKEIIKLVSENIKDAPNRIAVEGHTDSSPLAKKGKMSNWELSTERASSARKELEKDGIKSEKISRVVGYADTEPLFKDNMNDPRNRRISLILLPPKPEETKPPKVEEKTEPKPEPLPIIERPKEEPAPAPKPPLKPSYWEKPKDTGPDIGVKPQSPIDIKKQLNIPEAKSVFPPKPVQPVKPAQPEKPVLRPIQQPKPEVKPEPGRKAKTVEPAKKQKIDIKPQKPIEVIPELGK